LLARARKSGYNLVTAKASKTGVAQDTELVNNVMQLSLQQI